MFFKPNARLTRPERRFRIGHWCTKKIMKRIYDAKMKGETHLEKVHVNPSKNWEMRRTTLYF